jgi:4-hydroxy-tetrahydrodipicolinate reductase
MIEKVLINGAKGRMGTSLTEIFFEDNIQVIGVDKKDEVNTNYLKDENLMKEIDLIIDFSSPEGCMNLLKSIQNLKIPIVIGTTGLSSEEQNEILKLSKNAPVVFASNFSTGINLLNWLTEKSAEFLSLDFQTEIVELHHKNKKDAPSGTAITLGNKIVKARNLTQDHLVYSRDGIGERPENCVGIQAVRGGDIVGEHTVYFIGDGERIELTHKATDRKILSRGAYLAGKWVIGKEPGLYDMSHVLGLR